VLVVELVCLRADRKQNNYPFALCSPVLGLTLPSGTLTGERNEVGEVTANGGSS
jgi:hypothetical protein